jgi:hypothetical protein
VRVGRGLSEILRSAAIFQLVPTNHLHALGLLHAECGGLLLNAGRCCAALRSCHLRAQQLTDDLVAPCHKCLWQQPTAPCCCRRYFWLNAGILAVGLAVYAWVAHSYTEKPILSSEDVGWLVPCVSLIGLCMALDAVAADCAAEE